MAWEIDFASRRAGWPLNYRRHEGAQHLQGGRRRHPGMATTALVKIEARLKSKLVLYLLVLPRWEHTGSYRVYYRTHSVTPTEFHV